MEAEIEIWEKVVAGAIRFLKTNQPGKAELLLREGQQEIHTAREKHKIIQEGINAEPITIKLLPR